MMHFGAACCKLPCSDFKSSASAIPPPGRGQYKSNEQKDLLQYRNLAYPL
jgi:hypothetical protein